MGFGKPHEKCQQLSNSGDTLELQAPSRRGNSAGGWSNQSCKVIALETPEKDVGYRGSKSISDFYASTDSHTSDIVKEQRVDGSYTNLDIRPKSSRQIISQCSNLVLRCTLTSCESNSKVKIPSKQISFTRFYSTYRHNTENLPYKPSPQLSPWFITGLSDGESCFYLGIPKK